MNKVANQGRFVVGDEGPLAGSLPDHLDSLITEILVCIEHDLVSVALAAALTVPDICGDLEQRVVPGARDNQLRQSRYEAWFDDYVASHYSAISASAATVGLQAAPGVSGRDAFALRQAVLEGGDLRSPFRPGRPGFDRFAFVAGDVDRVYDPARRIVELGITDFVEAIVAGYRAWDAAVGTVDAAVVARRTGLGRLGKR